jgi:hypothetical protein
VFRGVRVGGLPRADVQRGDVADVRELRDTDADVQQRDLGVLGDVRESGGLCGECDAELRFGRGTDVPRHVPVGHVRSMQWSKQPKLWELRNADADVHQWDVEQLGDVRESGGLCGECDAELRDWRDADVFGSVRVGVMCSSNRQVQ